MPAERTKAGREHRVPLTDRMVEILDLVELIRAGGYVFPGQKRGRPLSSMALEMHAPDEDDDATRTRSGENPRQSDCSYSI